MPDLFDMRLRALRRDRAARQGSELFLLERVFDDCLERIQLTGRQFDRALLVGCPGPSCPERLKAVASNVEARDPGPLFAGAARGMPILEDQWHPEPAAYDLVIALGTLDTVNDLPLALRLVRYAMRPNGLFIGAMSGADTLPRLRSAMRAADAVTNVAAPHVHPRIEPSSLAPLLENAGFVSPVIDVERIEVAYGSFGRLVADLRSMACTNVLLSRPPALTREQVAAAAKAFAGFAEQGRTVETFEVLHFATWTPLPGTDDGALTLAR